MSHVYFPTLEEALYLHSLLIQRFGGSDGIRDLGLLESALARPRSRYYGSLSEQAAALMQSLAMNHAFVDGNKRMAYALCAVFLITNGYRLNVGEPAEAERFIKKQLIEGHADIGTVAAWLEKHMRPIRSRD